jgi:DNA-directed RNA polymerase subunit H (RpoH/RPB5)
MAMRTTRHLSTYLSNSHKVIIEMLQERGYDTSNLKESAPLLTSGNNISPIKLSKNDEMIEIHYEISSTRTNHKKISNIVKLIVESVEEKDKHKDLTIVFIVCDGMTPSVKEALRVLTNKYNVFIQIFAVRKLMLNITRHKIVPKHQRIPKKIYDEFIEDFLDSHHIDSLQCLPKIVESDPVAMFIGLKPGDICKITRPSLSAGKHYVYRYCISD